MRNKVRKSLAFLLALALVVSVMSGLGLSVSAEQESNTPGTEEVQQQDKTEAGAAPSAGKAEEEAAKPEKKPVLEEKEDEQKKQEETKTDDAAKDDANAQDGNQKNEPQAEPAEEEQDAPVEQASVPIVQAAAGEVSEYTITCGDQRLTVKLVDDSSKAVNGTAPSTTTLDAGKWKNINPNFIATVAGYTYSEAQCEYYYNNWDSQRTTITRIRYNDSNGGIFGGNRGWQGKNSNNGYEIQISENTIYLVYTKSTFTIHYVDEKGTEINPSTEHERTQSVTFSDYADSINGYTYWRACYGSANNAEVTKATRSGNSGNNYTFYKGDTELTKPKPSENMTSEEISKLNDIYLVYVKNGNDPTPGGTTGGSGSAAATNTKKAILNKDGTYDLSLTVSGSVGTNEDKAILDVIYVLDCSGSMDDSMGKTTRMDAAKTAINTMTESLVANNKIDAQFSLVKFAYTASTVQGWTGDKDVLSKAMKTVSANGATNYEAALTQAKSLLGTARGNASKVVVFVSDGIPTAYGNGYQGGGNNDSDGRAMSRARGVVKTMTPNYLFTVGVGPADNYANLSEVTDAVHSGVNKGVTQVNFEGTSEESLKSAFKIMEGSITSIACEKVTISDKLSANVAMVMADGKPKKLVGKVTDKDGNPVATASSDGKITLLKTDLNDEVTLDAPTYNSATRTFEWKFPDKYKLEANYTYTVTANVDVTETAFENYRKGTNGNSNQYPDTPDAGTGTHASEKGLFSNDNENAKLTYKVTGESTPKEVKYQKPVVQLTPSKLTIKKTVTGLDETALEQLKNNLKFKVTYTYANESTKEEEISFDKFDRQSDGTYSYTSDTLDCWSMNATYTVEETGYNVEAYDRTGSGNTRVTGDIKGKNQNAIATFTNKYQHKNVTVTIKKEVTGNMSQTSDKFTFSVTNPNNLANGDKSFKLSADDTDGKTISIPYGSDFTITETPSNGYTLVKVNGTAVTDTTYELKSVTTDTTITFTNDKTINPPNGITTTIAPYAIMVVLAAGAGVYFVYSRRRRNH